MIGSWLSRALACNLLVAAACAPAADVKLDSLKAPPGFTVTALGVKVANARQLAFSPAGTLFVGSQREGKVYAVPEALDGGTEVTVIARGLAMPSGLAISGNDLYVGALNRILKFTDVDATLQPDMTPQLITDSLPDKRHHGWKYLSVGPGGLLYVPVGAPCNICLSEDDRFASILQMDPATGATRNYAAGIRNSVGMAWHSQTGELWFTDNGRDMLGDDVPAEEVNRVTRPGAHYGYPFIHAGDIADPEFGEGQNAEDYVSPVVKIQAHSAALGIDFYTGDQFPRRYHGALFIAEHGSWNRSKKVGYRVSVLLPEGDGWRYEPFITGWLQDQKNWGRPNDVLMAPDGSLLISDDQAGVVYRVQYEAATAG